MAEFPKIEEMGEKVAEKANQKIKDIIHDMSPQDKKRLMQCIFCCRDPMSCMSDDEDEDSHGLCKNYLGDVLFEPKGE